MSTARRSSWKSVRMAAWRGARFSLEGAAVRRRNWRLGSESNRRTRLCRPLHDHSATQPYGARASQALRQYGTGNAPAACAAGAFPSNLGAAEESRTLDLNLGKVALYQLSYCRMRM